MLRGKQRETVIELFKGHENTVSRELIEKLFCYMHKMKFSLWIMEFMQEYIIDPPLLEEIVYGFITSTYTEKMLFLERKLQYLSLPSRKFDKALENYIIKKNLKLPVNFQ